MQGRIISQLLAISKCKTLEMLSTYLGLSSRTINLWIEKNKEIDQPYVLAIQRFFETDLLKGPVQEIANEVYNEIQCELISIWLMNEAAQELILIRDTSRHQLSDVSKQNAAYFQNDEIHKSPEERSLTVYSTAVGILNLAGNDILEHPSKKLASRRCGYLPAAHGNCESLVKIAIRTNGDVGPKTRVILSLENVFEYKEESKTELVVMSTKEAGKLLFDKDEVAKLERLCPGFYIEHLQEKLLLLDYQKQSCDRRDFILCSV